MSGIELQTVRPATEKAWLNVFQVAPVVLHSWWTGAGLSKGWMPSWPSTSSVRRHFDLWQLLVILFQIATPQVKIEKSVKLSSVTVVTVTGDVIVCLWLIQLLQRVSRRDARQSSTLPVYRVHDDRFHLLWELLSISTNPRASVQQDHWLRWVKIFLLFSRYGSYDSGICLKFSVLFG